MSNAAIKARTAKGILGNGKATNAIATKTSSEHARSTDNFCRARWAASRSGEREFSSDMGKNGDQTSGSVIRIAVPAGLVVSRMMSPW